jgi:excinuclease ABC subunit C
VAPGVDRVYLPATSKPVLLAPGSGELHLLQRVRDEAHRFAVAYHRQVRGKRSRSSPLETITGLGKARRQALLKRFGGLRGLRAASQEEIQKVSGIGPVLARRILVALRGDGALPPEGGGGVPRGPAGP